MTGRYPIRYGRQYNVLRPNSKVGLSLDEQLLPQALRSAGYATVHVGKWHLGDFDRAYWPMQRGFDHTYGFVSAHKKTSHLVGAGDLQRDKKPCADEGWRRAGRWRGTKNRAEKRQDRATVPDKVELFNIARDVSEANNLAAAEPERVKELGARLDVFTQEAVPPILKPEQEATSSDTASEPTGWHRQLRISSTASFPRCPCGSG